MTKRNLKKRSRQLLAIFLTLLLILTLCSMSIFAVISEEGANPAEALHTHSIPQQDVRRALQSNVAYTTYLLQEYAPVRLAAEGETVVAETQEVIATTEYRLDPLIAGLIEELHFPQDSPLMKKQLLDTLQDLHYIQYYDYAAQTGGADPCQVLVAGDPRTEEILVIGLNPHTEAQTHGFRLAIIAKNGGEIPLYDTNLVAHTVTHQEDIAPEELLALQYRPDIAVEVLQEVETVISEPTPPDSLPQTPADPAPSQADPDASVFSAPEDANPAAQEETLPASSTAETIITDPPAPTAEPVVMDAGPRKLFDETPAEPPATDGQDLPDSSGEQPADGASPATPPAGEAAASQPEAQPPSESEPPADEPASDPAPQPPGEPAPAEQTTPPAETEPPAAPETELTYNVNIVSNQPLNADDGALPMVGSSMVLFSGTMGRIRALANATPASLSGYKTATKVNGTTDIFRIDLDIRGTDGIGSIGGSPADIVLVVDLSGSMDEMGGGRWARTKEALNTLAEGLLKPNVGHEIAMVGYSSQIYLLPTGYNGYSTAAHRTVCTFTASENTFVNSYTRDTAVSLITEGGIVKGTGTNSHAGFVGARDLLEARKDNGRPKFVIFITDGMANQYYSSDTPPYSELLDYSAAVDSAANIRAEDTAADIRNTYGASIFSVGVDFASTQTAKGWHLLRGTASSDDQAFMTSQDKLKQVISNIMHTLEETPAVAAHGTVTLTDNMSQYVEYQPSYGVSAYQSANNGASWSAYTGASQPSFTNNQLTWGIQNFSPDTLYRVSYYVRVKDEYHGQKLHLDQTDGANPASGPANTGVVANGDTFLSSDAVTRQPVPVPTVYVPKTVSTAASLTAHKTATDVSPAGENGVFDISVLFSGTQSVYSNGVETVRLEQTAVTLTDPMSEYVNYLGNVRLEMADKGGSSWSTITGGYEYDTATRTIHWVVPDFSSTKQYRLTYCVSVKTEYAGQRLHASQTSGKPGSLTPGTDGVVANGYTRIQSSLVPEQEILVPTVYLDNQQASTPATLTGNKTAQAVAAENGLYNIVITVDGQKEVKVTDGVPTYKDHGYIYLVDPMSEYVDYVGNPTLEWRPKGTADWTQETVMLGALYNTSARRLDWWIAKYTSDNEYRLTYQVRVREEYAGARLHADQTHGKRDGVEPLPGTDGVVANEYTYLASDLLPDSELFVPTVYREAEFVSAPGLRGLKTAAAIPDGEYEYAISIVITGEPKVENGYGGNIITDHTNVVVHDPMSEYVSYLGEPRFEQADKGADNWQPVTGTAYYNADTETLTWSIAGFSAAKQYRLTYRVQIEPEDRNLALHKDQTSGKPELREEGIDGVVANGYTYVSSSLVPEQEILVPAIGDPQPLVTGGELTGEKDAAYIPESNGLFNISLVFGGTVQQVTDLYGETTELEHENVLLTDPMSEYVDYAGEAALWIYSETLGDWELLDEQPAYADDTHTLTWQVTDFSSENQYRLTYQVQVKDDYAGARLHKTKTSGQSPDNGTDGVVANGKTTLSSTLVEEEEILVPAVYRSRILVSPGTIDSLKTAQPVPDETGRFTITIEVEGTDYVTDGYGGRQERDHNFLYVEDPMSEYVHYLDQYAIYAADVGTDDWQPVEDVGESFAQYTQAEDTGEELLQWYVLAFNTSKKYRLVYLVQLDPQYYGQALHKDQTSGDPAYRETGSDGVVANNRTSLTTEQITNQEIYVPTVYETLVTAPFTFYKVGREGAPLPDVEFSLYPCTQAADETHTHSLLATEGSCWDLARPIPAASTQDGLVDFGPVPVGDYILAETKAAPGYALPSGQWLVQLREDSVNFTARYEGSDPPPAFKQQDGVYTVANYQFSELPASGSSGIIGTTLAGIALLLAVLLGYRLKCQRKLQQASAPRTRRGAAPPARSHTGGKQHIRHDQQKKWGKEMKTKFLTRTIVALLTLVMALALAPLMAFANEAPVMPATGTLVIHKYKIDDPSEVLSGKTPGVEITDGSLDTYEPLGGIGFEVTLVKPEADGSYPETAASVTAAQLDTDKTYTQTTTPAGLATFSDLPSGVYLVRETSSNGHNPIAPFLVQLPMTNADGNGWMETVHVYPKNQTLNPSKKADGQQYDPLNPAASDSIVWTINTPIPSNMDKVTQYDITDEIDALLVLDTTGAVVVSTVAARGAATGTAVPEEYYVLTRTNNTLSVSFTAEGIAYLGARYALNEPYVQVVFSTTLTADALGKVIDNQVELEFTNDQDTYTKEIPDSEIPSVYTGAIKINKTDKDGLPLDGAVFKVAATLADAQAGTYLKDHEGNDLVATTGTDGVAILSGLSYGQPGDAPDDATKHGSTTFYLVEVQAPDGYNLLHDPVEVTFNYEAVTDADGNIINYFNNGKTSGGEDWKIVNTKGFTLPETGANGIILSTVLGVLLLAAVIVIVARRKLKREHNH